MQRRCLDCNRRASGSRCPEHQRAKERTKQQRRGGSAGWRERRRLVEQHVERYGWVCPGWGGQGPHRAYDLTFDHLLPLALGGSRDGPGRALCRSCNSRRGAALDLGEHR
jgi:5-methylcytosine-specific restriction endonuclease McrA